MVLKKQSWYVSAIDYHSAVGDANDQTAMYNCYENTVICDRAKRSISFYLKDYLMGILVISILF